MRVRRHDREWVWTPGMVVAIVGSLLGVVAAFAILALNKGGSMAVFWVSIGLGLLSSFVYYVTWSNQKGSDERLRKHSWSERLLVWGGHTVVGFYCALALYAALTTGLVELFS